MKRTDLHAELMRLICQIGNRHYMASRLEPQTVFDLRTATMRWLDDHGFGEADHE